MPGEWGIREFKAGFFDAEKIKKAMDAEARKQQSQLGAHIRKRIKSSLRYRKKVSAPGGPPSAHRSSRFTRRTRNPKTGVVKKQFASPLRELTFFAWDPQTRSTVVGPAKFGDTGAPRRLEKGGAGAFTDPDTGEKKRGYWRPRPFVQPAGEAESRAFLRNRAK